MNRYRLAHVTAFHYDGIVSDSYNVVRLRPRDDGSQTCLSFKLQTTPAARAPRSPRGVGTATARSPRTPRGRPASAMPC